jgi:hypothetical protein
MAGRPVRATLELIIDDGRLSGRVLDEAGGDQPFTGWLALISLLENLADPAIDDQAAARSMGCGAQPGQASD